MCRNSAQGVPDFRANAGRLLSGTQVLSSKLSLLALLVQKYKYFRANAGRPLSVTQVLSLRLNLLALLV